MQWHAGSVRQRASLAGATAAGPWTTTITIPKLKGIPISPSAVCLPTHLHLARKKQPSLLDSCMRLVSKSRTCNQLRDKQVPEPELHMQSRLLLPAVSPAAGSATYFILLKCFTHTEDLQSLL